MGHPGDIPATWRTHGTNEFACPAESEEEDSGCLDVAITADPVEPGRICFFDLDGHPWQVMWMDPAAAQQGTEESPASTEDAAA